MLQYCALIGPKILCSQLTRTLKSKSWRCSREARPGDIKNTIKIKSISKEKKRKEKKRKEKKRKEKKRKGGF
jgi:hypothetical protein